MDDEELCRIVGNAALPISIEIDNMLSLLPADADPMIVVCVLLDELSIVCDHTKFVNFLIHSLAARQALEQLGIKVSE